jgi:hypothetical protein
MRFDAKEDKEYDHKNAEYNARDEVAFATFGHVF